MNLSTMKQFFYSFWVTRNKRDPEKEWLAYKKLVDHVNEEYGGTYEKGFQTDRGRVMLQYGKPDRIVERKNKPHSYPYEIWQYYEIGNFTNKRFVFYDTDLSGNDYSLLHSDMPGEIRNRRWRRHLQDRQNVMDKVDEEGVRDHYGREVNDNFKNP
ncbi:MAG: GWxTD domain-containing protein [Flavobacteriales bacterium]